MKLANSAVILWPAFTEKSEKLRSEKNIYVFFVNQKATKKQIEKSVEELFGVKVESVKTVNTHPKLKRKGAHAGYRSRYKKAYVKLVKGEIIQGFEAA
ncbi:50S ribosomal protein L23 [bacterium]|nr:50S ribosomal protein L23 [bacterium]MBU3955746.1 50S ribosomal protein L23 [bacterium]